MAAVAAALGVPGVPVWSGTTRLPADLDLRDPALGHGAVVEVGAQGDVLEVGRVVMDDTCQRLMQSKDIQEFYLGAKEDSARGERRWKKKKTWR